MTIFRTICFLVSLVGFAGTGFADQTDPRLNALFGQLKAASGPAESVSIEQEIWAVWLDAPDEATQSLLDSGMDAMHSGDLAAALEAFDEVVALTPAFAEGWNKRATVHYLLNNLQQSLEDIAETLKLEPRHFGALSGRGLVFIKLGDLDRALSAFEQVLECGNNENQKNRRYDESDYQHCGRVGQCLFDLLFECLGLFLVGRDLVQQ